MPFFFLSCEVGHSRQHNTRDGDGAERSWDSQQLQPEPAAAAVLPAGPPPEQLPRGMIETAARVPLPRTPGQPARDGEVGGSRRVGELLRPQVHRYKTQTNVCPAVVRKRWRSAAAVDVPSVPLLPGRQARRKAEGVGDSRATSLHDFFFPCEVRHSRQRNTRDGDGAKRSWDSQQLQPEPAAAVVLPSEPPPERLPRGMIQTAARPLCSSTSSEMSCFGCSGGWIVIIVFLRFVLNFKF